MRTRNNDSCVIVCLPLNSCLI